VFGGITMGSDKAPMKGIWLYEGVKYKDQIVKIEIATEESEMVRKFFHNYKEKLKEMFEQLDIFITIAEVKTL